MQSILLTSSSVVSCMGVRLRSLACFATALPSQSNQNCDRPLKFKNRNCAREGKTRDSQRSSRRTGTAPAQARQETPNEVQEEPELRPRRQDKSRSTKFKHRNCAREGKTSSAHGCSRTGTAPPPKFNVRGSHRLLASARRSYRRR